MYDILYCVSKLNLCSLKKERVTFFFFSCLVAAVAKNDLWLHKNELFPGAYREFVEEGHVSTDCPRNKLIWKTKVKRVKDVIALHFIIYTCAVEIL